ncbi:SGNH hydrolase domain-containing protein [Sporichthya polymorpha]|uniref:SGNH hydrolase domain-containing protein n=1 Tax=Sporichthya polymorpha TaxID=35751 RepID=UPI00035EB593|nr:SGNH hydrolase domain-containing protein [Sporichthya polymorpha]
MSWSGIGVAAATLGLALTVATPSTSAITPEPVRANQDLPAMYDKGCQQNMQSAHVTSCRYGPGAARTTIAVFGDSKMAQWLPALERLAPRHGWRIVTYTKSNCVPADLLTTLSGNPYTSCRQWVRKVLNRLTGPDRPDLVLTTHRHSASGVGPLDEQRRAVRDALVATWSRLRDSGVPVVVMADNPSPPRELTVWKCVAEQRPTVSPCAFDREQGIDFSAAPVQRAAVIRAGGPARVDLRTGRRTQPAVAWVDLVDAICPGARCSPVLHGLLVYREGSHLTATFVRALSKDLERALLAAGVPSAASDGIGDPTGQSRRSARSAGSR